MFVFVGTRAEGRRGTRWTHAEFLANGGHSGLDLLRLGPVAHKRHFKKGTVHCSWHHNLLIETNWDSFGLSVAEDGSWRSRWQHGSTRKADPRDGKRSSGVTRPLSAPFATLIVTEPGPFDRLINSVNVACEILASCKARGQRG